MHQSQEPQPQVPEESNYALLIRERIARHGDKTALRTKRAGKWESWSWRQLGEKLEQAAGAMLKAGLEPQQMVGIYSQNKPECTIVDIAALSIRCVPVFIYPTNTAEQAEYIVNDAEARLLFVGDQEQYDKAVSFFGQSACPEKIIAFDRSIRLDASADSMYFDDFLELGKDAGLKENIDDRLKNASQSDILTLIYTSGTTGTPKGVILTHYNILFSGAIHDIRLLNPDENDVSLCFLPLSHVFERAWSYYALSKGMEVVYLEDPKEIIGFIGEVRPTVMCAVPRIFEKIYAAAFHKLESASPAKKRLFQWAVEVGRRANNCKKDQLPVPPGLKFKHMIADRLVLKKIRELVGGRIRFMPCAGAPLSQEIEEFFYAVGLFVWYGYGLSETTATVTCHPPYHFQFGLVGTPMPGVDVKIADNGEILIKGGNVMQGYYKKPDETAAAFADGWFKTGDVGEFSENGELRITDRIKDLMKTSGGKYIAPQVIESVVGADHFIEQAVVVGEQKKFVSALIVPDFEALEEYARSKGIDFASRAELVNRPDIVEMYRSRIEQRQSELAEYEKIKQFRLLSEPFSVDRNEITPTMKIKRKLVADKFKQTIEDMYNQ